VRYFIIAVLCLLVLSSTIGSRPNIAICCQHHAAIGSMSSRFQFTSLPRNTQRPTSWESNRTLSSKFSDYHFQSFRKYRNCHDLSSFAMLGLLPSLDGPLVTTKRRSEWYFIGESQKVYCSEYTGTCPHQPLILSLSNLRILSNPRMRQRLSDRVPPPRIFPQ